MSFSPYISFSAGDFAGILTDQDLIYLTNDGSNSGEVNTVVLTSAIEAVQEVIDGKLRRVTTVPLTTAPLMIKRLEAALVADHLRLRRHKVRDMDQKALYDSLMKQLEEIASKKILLESTAVDPAGGVVFEPGSRAVNDDSFEEVYTDMMES